MALPRVSYKALQQRIRELEEELYEAQDTLRALRDGEVDAIVTAGPGGDQVFTLQGADEAYRLMIQNMAESAVTLTREGLILFANEQFATFVNAPLGQVIGKPIFELMSLADSELFRILLRESHKGLAKAEIKFRVDGEEVPAYVAMSLLQQNEMVCFCAIITDLRERQRTEQLLEAERLSRSILQQVGEALLVVEADGRIVRASSEADNLAGLPVAQRRFDEVLALSIADESGVLTPHLYETICSETGPGRLPERREVVVNAEVAERSRNCLLTARPLFADSQELLGCVVTLIDITERKRSETALRMANDDLSQFAYAAAHDLREPLRNVRAYTELLVQLCADKQTEKVIRTKDFIVDSVHRMDLLLKDLLEYTSLAAHAEDEHTSADCREVVQQAVQNLQSVIEQANATVSWADLPVVTGREMHYVQLFQNLIENAIKYRSNEPPKVCISAKKRQGEWLFSVRDNGIGIQPQYQQQIFGLFKRLHGRTIPGTGIGLAICEKIVERRRGRIWVESELGRGAEFLFTIPASAARNLSESAGLR